MQITSCNDVLVVVFICTCKNIQYYTAYNISISFLLLDHALQHLYLYIIYVQMTTDEYIIILP